MTSKKDQEQYWTRLDEPYSFISVKEFAEAFQSFHIGQKLGDDLAIPFDKSKSHPDALSKDKYGVPKKELLKACLSRELLLMKRNLFVYVFKMFQVSKENYLKCFLCFQHFMSELMMLFLMNFSAYFHWVHNSDNFSKDRDASRYNNRWWDFYGSFVLYSTYGNVQWVRRAYNDYLETTCLLQAKGPSLLSFVGIFSTNLDS